MLKPRRMQTQGQAACACEEFKRSWTLTDCLRGGLGFKCCWGAHAANPRLPPGRADSSSYDGPSVCAGFASLEPTSVGSNMVPGRRVYSGQLQHAPRPVSYTHLTLPTIYSV